MINIDKNNRIMESISYTSFNKISPTDRLKNTTIIKYVAIAFLILTSSYLWSYFWHTSTCNHNNNNVVFNLTGDGVMYDSKYPLSDPIIMKSLKFYKIGIIADLDQERSKTRDGTYKRKSYMKIGSLKVDDIGKIYSVEFPDEKYELTTYLTEKGEFSLNNKYYPHYKFRQLVISLVAQRPKKNIALFLAHPPGENSF